MEFFRAISGFLLVSFVAADGVKLGAVHGGGLDVGLPVGGGEGGLYRGDVEILGHGGGGVKHGGHVHGLFPHEFVTGIQSAKLVKSELRLPGLYPDGIPHVVGGNFGGHHGGSIISGGGLHGGSVVAGGHPGGHLGVGGHLGGDVVVGGGGHHGEGVFLDDGGFGSHHTLGGGHLGGGLAHGADIFVSDGHINSIGGGHNAIHRGDVFLGGHHGGGYLGGW
ncbi:acanthoscurrin-2-like [Macrobrachium nipponense]|uniref:acanthoscurrin-2-like n=1 Tax=Macrobrachium nipponense TaxID=159736 RepID=UPI0030C7D96C